MEEAIEEQTLIVESLKREMEALYEEYDAQWTNADPKPPRAVEAQLEEIAWAKECEYTKANHKLSLMRIRQYKARMRAHEAALQTQSQTE